jgi:Sulfatase
MPRLAGVVYEALRRRHPKIVLGRIYFAARLRPWKGGAGKSRAATSPAHLEDHRSMITQQLAYWAIVSLAAVVFLGANLYFRRTVTPGPALEYRTWSAAIIGHCLPQAAVMASLMLLLQLAVAPLLLMSTVLLSLLFANNKKFRLLNEPLTPSDVVVTMHQIHSWPLLARYVRRTRRMVWVLPAALALSVVALACEPWLLGQYRFSLALLSAAPMAIVFAPLRGRSLFVRLLDAWEVPFWDCDLPTSVAVSGFLPTFLRCIDNVPRPAVRSMSEASAKAILAEKFGDNGVACLPPDRKPNIVVVLAEAFMDPRSMGLLVDPDPLTSYDDAVRRSVYSGSSWVPVYGGWTVRSEYSLLTGIGQASFDNNIGNPNTTLVRTGTHSLPKHLKTLGYRTTIIHPHDRRFYRRDNACALLGFDRFLDEHDFAGAPREGLYVSDVAIAARIEEELRDAAEPAFLYCVTMENHGPWDDEAAPLMPPFTTQPPLSPAGHLSFAHYLRHLRSANRMIRRLNDMVAAAEAPTILLLVGDHLPSLTDLFREIAFPMFDPGAAWTATAPWLQTPYFVLSNMHAEHHRMDCDISFLPGLLLDCAGLNGDRFFHANSQMRRRLNGNLHSDADSTMRQAYLRVCYEIATFPERYASAPWQ